MSLLLSMTSCPNCGAPLSVEPGLRNVICIFCNTSLFVERPATGAAVAQIRAQSVSKDDIERVKQLLVDGKRDEAIAHYARAASVSRDEAERAVESVFLSAYWTLVRHLPINGFGFFLHAVFVFGGAGIAAWAATQAAESPAYLALVAAGGLFAILQLARFLRHLASTLVASFGSLGRGRVLRCSVVREFVKQNGFLVVVVFEVVPDDGSPAFVDQETLLAGKESLRKLSPGNVVRVRFDGARKRVFPTTPVTVLATGV
ncbi:hypothetical protein WME99_32675 [Sorangium sp. So ce136]|uniref:hypothetical protein n=1 Tax=Sorangium sp. So ce136 TaxID=3133284 RepID=UPI003F062832